MGGAGGDFGAYADAARDLSEMNREADGAVYALPPEEPPLPPGEWMRKNLFSSWLNSILTIVSVLLIYGIVKGILGFVFSSERQWDAIATNLRLLFSGAYPEDQMVRIWVSLGLVITLAGLSAALWNLGSLTSVRRLAIRGFVLGGSVAAIGLLAPFSGGARIAYLAVGAGIIGVSVAARAMLGDRRPVPNLGVTWVGLALVVGSLWVVPYGRHAFIDGQVRSCEGTTVCDGTVAMSTKAPWTILLIVLAVAYFVGKALAGTAMLSRLRAAMLLVWLLSPLIVIYIILRDPDFDWGHIASTEIPMLLTYAIGGGALLYALASPRIGEVGRVIAGIAVLAAAATFLTPMLQVARILALLLAAFALAAPTFSGDRAARIRYVAGWVAVASVTMWLVTAINSPSTVEAEGQFFTAGFSVTLIVALLTMICSFPLGVILALARTSKMPIFRVLSTLYIEFVRGIPLITILIFFSVMVPLFLPENMEISEMAGVTLGFTLFSAAYLAENVRGGLQSIRQGQYEAAEALGMTTAQKTVFIILPQALRVSIPPLVGQLIATFKETSLLAIIGVFDLLYIARTIIPNQTDFIGSTREGLLVISFVYWIFSYAMSRASQNLERTLGVGER